MKKTRTTRNVGVVGLLLLGAPGLGGCVSTRHVWAKAGVSAVEVQRDNAGCAYEAEAMCGTQYALNENELANRKARYDFLYKNCMLARGYTDREIED